MVLMSFDYFEIHAWIGDTGKKTLSSEITRVKRRGSNVMAITLCSTIYYTYVCIHKNTQRVLAKLYKYFVLLTVFLFLILTTQERFSANRIFQTLRWTPVPFYNRSSLACRRWRIHRRTDSPRDSRTGGVAARFPWSRSDTGNWRRLRKQRTSPKRVRFVFITGIQVYNII